MDAGSGLPPAGELRRGAHSAAGLNRRSFGNLYFLLPRFHHRANVSETKYSTKKTSGAYTCYTTSPRSAIAPSSELSVSPRSRNLRNVQETTANFPHPSEASKSTRTISKILPTSPYLFSFRLRLRIRFHEGFFPVCVSNVSVSNLQFAWGSTHEAYSPSLPCWIAQEESRLSTGVVASLVPGAGSGAIGILGGSMSIDASIAASVAW